MNKQELEKEIKKICDEKGWGYDRAKKHFISEMYQSFSSPTGSDVHIPTADAGQGPQKKEGKMYMIKSLPIFKIGIHHDTPYTIADLDELVKNTNVLIKSKLIDPPIKLGHDENQKIMQHDGYPAGGYAQVLERIGDEIFADVDYMPEQLYQCIEKRAYTKISPEIYDNYPHPVTKEPMGLVLKAIAVLGADIPEVKGMGDILNMYGSRTQVQKFSFTAFAVNDLQEASAMKGKWTVERATQTYGCCGAEFKKFAEENKTNEIPGDKVAEIVAKKSAQKMADAAGGADKIECPDGFTFDEAAQRCMPSNNDKEKVKPEEQKVCPKGWTWDDASGKCIKAQVQENKAAPKMDSKKLVMEMMKARGKKIDETKDMDEQMPDDKELEDMISKMKAGPGAVQSADKKPDEWTDDDALDMKSKHEKDTNPEKDKFATYDSFPGDAKPPKEWWDKCIAKTTGKSDTPEKLCGHVWANQMGPDAKAKSATKTEEGKSDEVKQMNEQIRGLTVKKFKETVDQLKQKHRGVFVPALDTAVDMLTEHIAKNESVIKFSADGKPEKSFAEMWVDFLADIAKRKQLIFGEMAKANDTAGKGAGNMEIIKMTESEKKAKSQIFSEVAPGIEVSNIEFAESAKAYAAEKKIPLKQAQQELGKILREKQEAK